MIFAVFVAFPLSWWITGVHLAGCLASITLDPELKWGLATVFFDGSTHSAWSFRCCRCEAVGREFLVSQPLRQLPRQNWPHPSILVEEVTPGSMADPGYWKQPNLPCLEGKQRNEWWAIEVWHFFQHFNVLIHGTKKELIWNIKQPF